jgi:ABC-type branched-subunit amino acid transport system substrate-binding protein
MQRRQLVRALAAAAAAPALWAQERPGATWRIARSLPLTGPQSAYGEAKRDGGDAFAAMVNAKGGIGGRTIAFHTADDAYLEQRTAENVANLAAAHNPIAFAGFFGAPQCAAAAKALAPLKLAGVGFTTGSNAFRDKPQREVFPVRASFLQETRAIVTHHKTTGVPHAVIAYVDIPFGQLARGSFEAAAKQEGLRLLDPVLVRPDSGNLREAAAALRATNSVVLMALHTPVAIGLVKELRGSGSMQQLWCLSAVDTAVLSDSLQGAARGVSTSLVMPSPGRTASPIVREYLAATQAIHKPATSYGLEAFLEMKTLAAGLARMRGADPQQLVGALESLGRFDLGGLDVQYGAGDRTGSRFVDLAMVTSQRVTS